ncbi:hypothetical protein VNO78_08307 [Psophocarpus tetragonolobus]|uniref:Uncharacterized protein n=1 Tax=Psophocarpus tetragonolobus TaxID=3891 RepID=A0AAN9SUQ8_PSOTE
MTVQRWLSGCGYKDTCANCYKSETKMWKSLYDFPQSFVSSNLSVNVSLTYDDEDLSVWEYEANRWDDLIQFAKQSCSVFWSGVVTEDTALHGAVKGKLGGPSQRRLSFFATIAVLQAIMSVKAVSLISLWCNQIKRDAQHNSAFTFMWQFFWRTTRSSLSCTEIGAEISLATYEALVSILKVLASTYFAHSCCLVEESEQLFPETEGRPHLDYMGVYYS